MMKLMMIAVCMACIAAVLVPVDAAIPERDHQAVPLRNPVEYQTKPQKEVRHTASGSCGDDCSWVLDTESGLLTISGSGKIVDNNYSGYKTNITTVVINDGITYIGNSMFSSFTELTKVTIANSVSFIGYRAFFYCSSLAEVNLPNSLISISPSAFYNCSSLKDITIPESVTVIGDEAFSYSSLTSVTIPESVTFIDYRAFYDCQSLENVSIPDSILYISDSAFGGCDSLRYNVKDGVNYSGNAANPYVYLVSAEDTSITSFNVSEQTKIIGNEALKNCDQLVNINIPNSVVYVGSKVFPDSLQYTEENHVKYVGNSENPYHVLVKCDGDPSCQINPKTKIIVGNAFYNTAITNITIPDSVTSIGDYAFYYASQLKAISIPKSVTFIPDYAFSYSGLTDITIPNSVTFIGYYAMSTSASLTSVTIGSSVSYIGSYAFSSCYSLTDLCYTGSMAFDHKFSYFYYTPLITKVKVTSKYNYPSFCGMNASVNNSCVECMVSDDCISSMPICKDGECVSSCGDGMYADVNNMCQQCKATCRTCDNGESCTGCIDGKVLMNGECGDRMQEWTVVIEMKDDVTLSGMSAYDVISNVSLMSGIPEDELSVSIEYGDHNKILRIILYVDGENTATTIKTAIESC